MARYSQERRESLVRRMLSGEMWIAALARESAEMSLYRWRNRAKANDDDVVSKSKKQDKLNAALPARHLSEPAIAAALLAFRQ
ncbi:MAG TPA: hypothetical protein VHK24_07590 [Steroidobacter sp.]|nr:hypothetical protein [Steroidobacter sp.]